MKNLICIIVILFLFTSTIYCQVNEYKTHLFLGTWVIKTEKDVTTEKWELSEKGEMKGYTIYENDKGSVLSETMRLLVINGKLNLCATVLEKDPGNPQGEICFGLKSYYDKVFLFENLNHDFPKRITYDFSGYNSLAVRIEGDTNSFDLKFERYFNLAESFTLKCKITKEQFINKAGRMIDNVFDYYCNIQGEKYFIKTSSCNVSKELIDNNTGKDIYCTVIFRSGLWDTDDNTHQSRIGKYISIINIKD